MRFISRDANLLIIREINSYIIS